MLRDSAASAACASSMVTLNATFSTTVADTSKEDAFCCCGVGVYCLVDDAPEAEWHIYGGLGCLLCVFKGEFMVGFNVANCMIASVCFPSGMQWGSNLYSSDIV